MPEIAHISAVKKKLWNVIIAEGVKWNAIIAGSVETELPGIEGKKYAILHVASRTFREAHLSQDAPPQIMKTSGFFGTPAKRGHGIKIKSEDYRLADGITW